MGGAWRAPPGAGQADVRSEVEGAGPPSSPQGIREEASEGFSGQVRGRCHLEWLVGTVLVGWGSGAGLWLSEDPGPGDVGAGYVGVVGSP